MTLSGEITPSGSGIRVNGRDVFFYEDVTTQSMLLLIEHLRALDGATTRTETQYKIPITLHIQSFGGETLATMGMIDQMAQLRSPLHSYVVGAACSSATMLSMVCQRRFIYRNSFMMIHQISGMLIGTYSQMNDDRYVNDHLMDRIIEFYMTHSKMSKGEVTERLKHNAWFNAQDALKFGLVDEIVQ